MCTWSKTDVRYFHCCIEEHSNPQMCLIPVRCSVMHFKATTSSEKVKLECWEICGWALSNWIGDLSFSWYIETEVRSKSHKVYKEGPISKCLKLEHSSMNIYIHTHINTYVDTYMQLECWHAAGASVLKDEWTDTISYGNRWQTSGSIDCRGGLL